MNGKRLSLIYIKPADLIYILDLCSPFVIMDIFGLEFVFSFFPMLWITYRNQIERNDMSGKDKTDLTFAMRSFSG